MFAVISIRENLETISQDLNFTEGTKFCEIFQMLIRVKHLIKVGTTGDLFKRSIRQYNFNLANKFGICTCNFPQMTVRVCAAL